jgi:H+/gluconate symporter-like permease
MDNTQDQRSLGTETISVFRPVLGTPPTTYQVKVVAYPIQIRWKAEDRMASSTSSSSVVLGPTAPSAAPTTSNTSNSHSLRLSGGAKGGIGAAVAVVGLITVALLGYWWFKRRRSSPRAENSTTEPSTNFVYPRAELDAAAIERRPAELPSFHTYVSLSRIPLCKRRH